ncbi:hypothetical protein DRF65_10425 [Chryseobacterium pennae]|uniref:Uncharacterized protein n=1 Tax=Chryseobacterium pennae TaxID=2258962 RepID=A0A3D9C9Q6_9FLAO|nr:MULTISPECIES: hypothetical protein [Chryseobacterium]MCS4301039.1 hypothetical protein [Chryseobacterium sp. BIGb0232]REC62499.1 hypothetical protein DRF65_10425 [Chryseobacterium pennae]ROS20096.1 hypothetical protein EDF65_0798 [Chryseobacterium nakagawai]
MNKRKLLEKKEWEYYVFEENNTIELSVPIPNPIPGFDITYTLSEPEREKYLHTGIKALEERIQDMKVNFSNYKMNSWR